jgi:biopolymer transport protein ExbD
MMRIELSTHLFGRCRLLLALFALFMLTTSVVAQSEKRIVPPGTWADAPPAPSKMNVRIKQVAKDYKQYKDLRQFSRIGLFDMVQRLDEQEYVALAGHALSQEVQGVARVASE